MANELKFTQLLVELHAATRAGKVVWETTPDESMFRAVLHHGMVRVGECVGFDEEERELRYYVAWLLDRRGNVVDELEVRGGPDYALLEELYQMARRAARDATGVLDGLLTELKTLQGSAS